MPPSRVAVFGLFNTGTNLASKLVEADDSIINIDIERRGTWKHALLNAEKDKNITPHVDEVIMMTRHPCTWYLGMDKSPYGTKNARNGDTFNAKRLDRFSEQAWFAANRGNAWNTYYSAAARFQEESALPVRFVRYEDLLGDDGLDKWVDAAREGGVSSLTPETYDKVLSRKAKTHGKPRTRQKAQRVANAGCSALDKDVLDRLKFTVDLKLAASFGYDVW